MPEYSGQSQTPDPFTLKELASNNWKNVIVKISNSFTTLRYLTSKLVYTDLDFSSMEAVVLFCAFEEVMLKIEQDPSARAKYMHEIFTFRAVYQSLDRLIKLEPSQRLQMMKETYGFHRGKIFSRRYYFAVEGQANKLYLTFIKTRFPKRFPAKAFVGKGYGDHGTARNEALDGTPSWQEVASLEVDIEGGNARDPDFFRSLQVHQSQLLGVLSIAGNVRAKGPRGQQRSSELVRDVSPSKGELIVL